MHTPPVLGVLVPWHRHHVTVQVLTVFILDDTAMFGEQNCPSFETKVSSRIKASQKI